MSLHLLAFVALAPLLWAATNHIDKYLISKYFKGGGIGGLMIFSTFFSIITLPIILIFDDQAYHQANLFNILILITAGILNSTAIFFYLRALDHDEVSVVMPFAQLVPVFTFILSYLLLKETLQNKEIIAGLTILFGVSLLTLKTHGGLKFKFNVFNQMVIATLLYASYGVLFKFAGIETGFWSGAFWQSVGLVLTGFIFFSIPTYRKEFFDIIKDNSKAVLGINLLSETLTILGNWVATSSSLLAPVALVSLVAGLQPLFVFIIGVIITLALPQLGEEDMTKHGLIQKIVSIAIIIFGTYLLY